MKIKLTSLIFSVVLLSNCNSFNMKVERLDEVCYNHPLYSFKDKKIIKWYTVRFTNTSKNNVVKAIYREIKEDGTISHKEMSLYPGVIKDICLEETTKVIIVGEKEISKW